jgi:hypothetical protein
VGGESNIGDDERRLGGEGSVAELGEDVEGDDVLRNETRLNRLGLRTG